jgi:hypothetical protein
MHSSKGFESPVRLESLVRARDWARLGGTPTLSLTEGGGGQDFIGFAFIKYYEYL